MSFLTGTFRSAVAASSLRTSVLSARPALSIAQVRGYASAHEEESYEDFNARYVQFFSSVEDLFELQRGLNNCFSYDLVPSPSVIEAALHASRRVNDFSTAVRIFEGLKEKVENKGQYEQYLAELEPLRKDLGVVTKDELYGH